MLIGLLQCGEIRLDLVALHGDYPKLYADLVGEGFDWRTWRVFRGEIPEAEACDAWLVSGSRFGAYEDHDWIPPLEDLLRRIHGTRPLVGICFGHQIIAQALGGTVEKFRGGWAVGRQTYSWEGRSVHLNAWHQDQVIRPPEAARTVMSSNLTAHAGLAIGPTTLTMQPHPEFSRFMVADMIQYAEPGTLPEPLLDGAAETLALPLDNALVGARLAAFFQGHAP